MGGVNHRGVTSSKLNHTIRNLSVHIRKNQKLTRGLKLEGSTGSEQAKTTRNLVRSKAELLFISWLGYSGKEDWLQKKDRKQRRPGCRRSQEDGDVW
jgi:hypothetical protein